MAKSVLSQEETSLALSLIGGPKLVILEWPTTGMDAKVAFKNGN